MTVFVDDMHLSRMGRLGRMKMSHMVATTRAELLDMADAIGVGLHHLQHAGTPNEHFDIALTTRAKAVLRGAKQVTLRQMAVMVAHRREIGFLVGPEVAMAWWTDRTDRSLNSNRSNHDAAAQP